MAKHTLTNGIDRLLQMPPLTSMLGTRGIEISRISAPKQTDTTQRWKIELMVQGLQMPLHTKVEFSRRDSTEEALLEPVQEAIARRSGIPTPTLQHYTAAAACRQKIGALAGRSISHARDIWDLDHLFRVIRAEARPLPTKVAALLPAAIDRAIEMPFDAFQAQVIPFLEADAADLFGTPDAWERMKESVVTRLTELQS